MANENKETRVKAPKAPKPPKAPKAPKEMSMAKQEKLFEKERAQRLKERHKAYKAAKKAGTLDERVVSPEHTAYLRRKAILGKIWPIFRFLILFGLCFVILYPLIYMFSTAFRPNVQMTDPSIIWIPKSLTFNNMIDAWDTMKMAPYTDNSGNFNIGALLNTLKINIVCSLLSVVVCAITGYGLARFNFKGKGICFAVLIMQIIVPPQITVIPLYLQWAFFKFFGIVNILDAAGVTTLFGRTISHSTYDGAPYISMINNPVVMYAPAVFANGIKSGLFIFIFRQFFRGLPIELEDAAYLDGCGPLKTFLKIIVPNAASSFLTVFLFSIVWYWNDYYISSTFFTNNSTVALQLQKLSGNLDQQLFGGAQVGTRKKIVWLESGCLLTIAPVLVMYIFLQKYFTEGLARSGLTGM